MTTHTIIGAGLTGLIAAHAWPDAEVWERESQPRQMHNALLRFRSNAIAALTGIPFREVQVRKGIWSEGAFCAPNICLANLYSRKVLGRTLSRSIWNLEPVQRFIAPEDFYARMVERVGQRIKWGCEVGNCPEHLPSGGVVSTVPLPALLKLLARDLSAVLDFHYAPITVDLFRVLPGCDVYQTVYFPDPNTALYRASITSDLLIAEYSTPSENSKRWARHSGLYFSEVFGVPAPQYLSTSEQRYGKIAPVDDAVRRALLARITQEYGIYTLGRFATWRNLLLDDLVKDIDVINRLQRSDQYAARIAAI
jgi:hypothetical protein